MTQTRDEVAGIERRWMRIAADDLLTDWARGAGGFASSDMSGAGGNPHGSGGSGVDVTTLGLPSPDRDKPVDASKFLKGAIKGTPITEPKMAKGGVIFVSVRKAGPDDRKVVVRAGGVGPLLPLLG